MSARPRVAMLSLSPLAHDTRVLRHAAQLQAAGFEVAIIAERPLPERLATPVLPLPGPRSPQRIRLALALQQAPAALLPASARLTCWLSLTRLAAWRALTRFRPACIVVNDWRGLPLAARARRVWGARLVYDSHEFATEEFMESRRWRLLGRRHVMEIERRGIATVDAVATVSAGLAAALERLYALPRRPVVIENRPDQPPLAPGRTGRPVQLLYHGIIAPHRGLEALVEASALTRAPVRLTLRGPSPAGYDSHLAQLAAKLHAPVTVAGPVPPDRLIEAAAAADIGFFLMAPGGGQATHALPNKVFEYCCAGLMVIASDLPEVARAIAAGGFGLTLPDNRPQTIARALDSLIGDGGPEALARIDAHRRAAHAAARDWQAAAPSAGLAALVAGVLDVGPAAAQP